MAELSRGQLIKSPDIIGIGDTSAKIRFFDGDENAYIDLKTPNIVGISYTLTFPPDAGQYDYVLVSDGNGVTSWVENPKYWSPTSIGINTLSNVGIGTTNPTSKLTVTGDVYISGVITSTTFFGQLNSGVATATQLNSSNAVLTNIYSTYLLT